MRNCAFVNEKQITTYVDTHKTRGFNKKEIMNMIHWILFRFAGSEVVAYVKRIPKKLTRGSNHRAIVCVLLCVLLCFTESIGCIEHFIEGDPPQCYDQDSNRVSGEYLSERGNILNNEHIIFINNNFIFNEGNFTHSNYHNIPNDVRIGWFKKNGDILTLNYNNGESIDYTVTLDGHVLIPVKENSTLPESEIVDDRFMRKLYCQ